MTAHLVRSRSGEEGINGFLHLHGADFAWPDDAAALADDKPGKIARRRVDLPPGLNHVRAYLDVLAPDGTPRDALEGALAALSRDLGERRNPTVFVSGGVTIRFGVELGLELIRAQQLAMLASVALALLPA
ncbi:MAG TPA: hypothetical protein VH165_27355 [Kofleriaceae bacterium]|nr:hypothetical protein [Kofleriaceae bacterium]